MRRGRVTVVGAFLVMLIASSKPAGAAPILDQQNSPPPEVISLIADVFDLAQTFTVGVRGTLNRVDVLIQRLAVVPALPLHFDIRRAPGGVPSEDDSEPVPLGLLRLERRSRR
jgi:hypothetical protein